MKKKSTAGGVGGSHAPGNPCGTSRRNTGSGGPRAWASESPGGGVEDHLNSFRFAILFKNEEEGIARISRNRGRRRNIGED